MNKNDSIRAMFIDLLSITKQIHSLDLALEEDLKRLAELQKAQELQRKAIEEMIDGDFSYRSDEQIVSLIQQCIVLEKELLRNFHAAKDECASQIQLQQSGSRAKQAYQNNYKQPFGYFLDTHN